MIHINVSGIPLDFPEENVPLLKKNLVMEAISSFRAPPEEICVAIFRDSHAFSMDLEDIFSLEAIMAENMFKNPVLMRGRVIRTIKRYPRFPVQPGEPRILRKGENLCLIKEKTFGALPGCGAEMLDLVRRIMDKNGLAFKME